MIEKTSKPHQLSPQQERNAFLLALATSISAALVSLYYFLPSSETPTVFFYPNMQFALLTINAFFAAVLARKGYAKTAVLMMLGGFYLILVITALNASGLDIILAILVITITFGVTSITLAPTEARKAIYLSFIIALFFFFLYFVEPFERETLRSSDTATWIIAGFFLLAFFTLIFRQFPSYALRTKLILAFVFLSSVGISVSFVFANFNMRNMLEESAEQRLLAGANASARNFDSFLSYSQDSVSSAATFVDLNAYLLVPKEERRGSIIETQAQNLLFALKNRNPDIISYGILDLDGNNILDSHTRNIGLSEAEYEYFKIPISQSGSYISPLLYLPEDDEPSLFISAAMSDNMGRPLGILRVQYNASVLQAIVDQSVEIAGKGSFIALLDENHIIMAHGFSQALIGKFPVAPDENTIELLKNSYVLPANQPNNTFSLGRVAIETGLNQFAETPYFSSPAGAENEPIFGAVAQLEETAWLIAAVQPQEIFLEPTQNQTKFALIVSIAIIIFAAIAGLGLAHILIVPIARLEIIAQKLSDGDLSVQAAIETEDEIGSLATTFNIMASRLQETIDTLEQRVQTRTEDLELRTSYLEGSADISRAISSITDPHQLALQVVDLIKERFDLYYIGLFLVDDKNEWAVLQAGTGEAGEKMLKNNHRIKIGEGMIGWSIARAEARIALDVGEDAVRFENPDLPKTRSESALPLRSRGRVIGALTVQSTVESAFNESIITTLQTMTDQIAVALDNAELFVKTEAALLSERKAYGQLSQQSWRTLSQSQAIPRFIVQEDGTVNSVKDIDKTINVAQAMDRGELLEDDRMTAIIPIKNHDYVLGGIKIRKTKGAKPWTKEELEVTQAISNQLSVALESARLFDQSQRKAEREAVISDITAKVGASMRMDTILRTTVQELGQALGSPEVTFELTDPETTKNK